MTRTNQVIGTVLAWLIIGGGLWAMAVAFSTGGAY